MQKDSRNYPSFQLSLIHRFSIPNATRTIKTIRGHTAKAALNHASTHSQTGRSQADIDQLRARTLIERSRSLHLSLYSPSGCPSQSCDDYQVSNILASRFHRVSIGLHLIGDAAAYIYEPIITNCQFAILCHHAIS